MFGMLAVHEEVAEYVLDDKRLEELPRDFYVTRTYTNFLIESIRENRDDGKPFLAYLAFTAPHDPMHVPEPWLSKYRGNYDDGYEVLKAQPETLKTLQAAWDRYADCELCIVRKRSSVAGGVVTGLRDKDGRKCSFSRRLY